MLMFRAFRRSRGGLASKMDTSNDIGPWWREPFYLSEHYRLDDLITAWCQISLVRRALDRGLRVHEVQRSGSYRGGRDDLHARVEALGGRLVTGGPPQEAPEVLSRSYVFPRGLLRVDYGRSGEATVHVTTTDEELAASVKAICDGFDEELERGLVHVVSRVHGCFSLRVATRAGLPLERDNYSPDVVGAFERVVADLGDRSPSGRLVLVEGPPGTGKTHLVRGLVHAVAPATFVLLPAEMVEGLDRPDLMPLMLDAAEHRERLGPLVLVIEDADACLVPRAADNMSTIRSLLNFSDGILGSAFDLRIIATTNARRFEIEPALLRSGRLAERLSVGALPRAQASRALARLTKSGDSDPTWPEQDVVLAEVYAEARRRRASSAPAEGAPLAAPC